MVHEVASLCRRQRSLRANIMLQVLSRHVLHDEKMQYVGIRIIRNGLTGVDGADDVRVLELSDGPYLRQKAPQQPRILFGAEGQHLDSHEFAHADMLGAEYHS